ncbi:hypothetical protein [Embleya sp. NBC_00896]|uniref:LppU/SCO3897 family protein n=1 Tax=Embleya sp. NBC_00896 TaxID=2975961 RepID=UPI003870834C|nr:hypothetical protein OG928_16880 [Embleya sp. NBC_00896]
MIPPEPVGPHVPAVRQAPVEGRASRRAAAPAKRSRRGSLIVLIVVLLLGGVAGGAWWYVGKEAEPRIHEGDCLADSADIDQSPVKCEDQAARFIVVERVQGTTFSGVCDSVPGNTVALPSDPTVESYVLCLAARK